MAFLSYATREQALEVMNGNLFGVGYRVDDLLPRGNLTCVRSDGNRVNLKIDFVTVDERTQVRLSGLL